MGKIPEDLKINKKVTEADKEEVDELHKKDKEIVEEVIASKVNKAVKNKKPEETTISTEAATKIPPSKEDTHEGDHQHIDMTIYISSAGKLKSVVWNLIAMILV